MSSKRISLNKIKTTLKTTRIIPPVTYYVATNKGIKYSIDEEINSNNNIIAFECFEPITWETIKINLLKGNDNNNINIDNVIQLMQDAINQQCIISFECDCLIEDHENRYHQCGHGFGHQCKCKSNCDCNSEYDYECKCKCNKIEKFI